MSAGSFEIGKYGAGGGTVYPVRVQPESKGLTLGGTANAYPSTDPAAGTPTLNLRRGRRAQGIIPRTATVRLTADGTGPTGDYLGQGTTHVVPVFTQTAWDAYGPKGQTGTYLGIACVFVSKNPELVR